MTWILYRVEQLPDAASACANPFDCLLDAYGEQGVRFARRLIWMVCPDHGARCTLLL